MATPLFAQYGGPAILSRGEAPAAMAGPQISFRPFVEVSGIYSTGLSGVSVDPQGTVPNRSGAGVNVSAGISGSHNWRHTTLGLSFIGGYSHYAGYGKFDSTDVSTAYGGTLPCTLTGVTRRVFYRDATLLSTLSQPFPSTLTRLMLLQQIFSITARFPAPPARSGDPAKHTIANEFWRRVLRPNQPRGHRSVWAGR